MTHHFFRKLCKFLLFTVCPFGIFARVCGFPTVLILNLQNDDGSLYQNFLSLLSWTQNVKSLGLRLVSDLKSISKFTNDPNSNSSPQIFQMPKRLSPKMHKNNSFLRGKRETRTRNVASLAIRLLGLDLNIQESKKFRNRKVSESVS